MVVKNQYKLLVTEQLQKVKYWRTIAKYTNQNDEECDFPQIYIHV